MKKAVIFDMDGVLIDSEPAYLEMNFKLFNELGIEMPEEEYKDFVGMDSLKMWTKIKNKYGLSESAEELRLTEKNLMKNLLEAGADSMTVKGVPELIREFRKKNYALSLASSSSRENIETVISKINLRDHFDFVISGDEVGSGKPEPDIFLRVSSEFNLPPEKCFVIEDSFNGIAAAKKAGMHCIGFSAFNSNSQNLSEADMIVNSFTGKDFKEIIKFIEDN